jgi:hypothetical protein
VVGKSTWRALRGGFEDEGGPVTSRLPLEVTSVFFLIGSSLQTAYLVDERRSVVAPGAGSWWSHPAQKRVWPVASSWTRCSAHAEHTFIDISSDGCRWAFRVCGLVWGRIQVSSLVGWNRLLICPNDSFGPE